MYKKNPHSKIMFKNDKQIFYLKPLSLYIIVFCHEIYTREIITNKTAWCMREGFGPTTATGAEWVTKCVRRGGKGSVCVFVYSTIFMIYFKLPVFLSYLLNIVLQCYVVYKFFLHECHVTFARVASSHDKVAGQLMSKVTSELPFTALRREDSECHLCFAVRQRPPEAALVTPPSTFPASASAWQARQARKRRPVSVVCTHQILSFGA